MKGSLCSTSKIIIVTFIWIWHDSTSRTIFIIPSRKMLHQFFLHTDDGKNIWLQICLLFKFYLFHCRCSPLSYLLTTYFLPFTM